MKKLFLHPLFFLGLILRLVCMAFFNPDPANLWYAPFLKVSLSASLTYDPWELWLAQGGSIMAFPYGYAMWLVFLPFSLLAKGLNLPILYGYNFTLLMIDALLLGVLGLMVKHRHLLLFTYWLSPIVILATYGLGLNDLVPTLFLVVALYFTLLKRLKVAGGFCTLAISAKLSMIMALPFFLIYLWNNKALRQRFLAFVQGLAWGLAVLGLPFCLSRAGMAMLFGNPEMRSVLRLTFLLSERTEVYFVVLAYLLALYLVWRIRRLNFALFHTTIGIVFFTFALFIPDSLGWLIWSVPFLVLYQAKTKGMSIGLVLMFSFLAVLNVIISPASFEGGPPGLLEGWETVLRQQDGLLRSLLSTLTIGLGLVIVLRFWRESLSKNDFFRLSRTPFVIGIAGDSATGKDTLATSLEGLFGRHSVQKLCGDDYHCFDRDQPIWQAMTHLNPVVNHLHDYEKDLMRLIEGKSIRARHYNHQTGQREKPALIKSNDFIIALGLHAFYLPMTREYYDFKIYLDMEEELRFSFKTTRDVTQRGHDKQHVKTSFEKRKEDAKKFIDPQAEYADLIFVLKKFTPKQLRLVACSRCGFDELVLKQALVGLCGLRVDNETLHFGKEEQISVEGEVSQTDIAIAAKKILSPAIMEFLDLEPKWQGGLTGVMQLLTLAHIDKILYKRLIRL